MNPAPELLHTYQQAEALLASGELRKAADLCKEMLDSNPEFPYGYHLMSSLFKATGTFEKALTFAQLAVHMDPGVAAFQVQRGQVLAAIEHWPQAATAFESAHLLDPNNAIPLLLWSNAVAHQRRFDEALTLVARARLVDDIVQVDEYEGMCRAMRGERELAAQYFDSVIARQPRYVGGHIHKGMLLMSMNLNTLAEASFARALKLDPNAEEALYGMALLNARQGHPEIAIRYAMQLIQAHPRAWRGHMLLGSFLAAQPHEQSAEEVVRQAHLLMPDNLYILQLLVGILVRKKRTKEALQRVESLLASRPDSRALQHMRAVLCGEQAAEASPSEYSAELFDGYAPRFDPHAQSVLAQKLPALLIEAAEEYFPSAANLRLLDLGCGSGVTAAALRDITEVRVGVDVSERMLDRARASSLYKELHALDMVEFMLASDRRFDLVTAVDVLMHSGNLKAFLQAARVVLHDSGLLAFTIEKEFIDRNAPDAGYTLQPNGHYVYAPHYVRELAQAEGYELVAQEDVVLRSDHYVPLHGMGFIFRKSQVH